MITRDGVEIEITDETDSTRNKAARTAGFRAYRIKCSHNGVECPDQMLTVSLNSDQAPIDQINEALDGVVRGPGDGRPDIPSVAAQAKQYSANHKSAATVLGDLG